MADSTTYTISSMKLSDGTAFNVSALTYVKTSSKNNLEIASPKNINLEPTKSIKFKPGNGAQVEFVTDNTGDIDEALVKALRSVDSEGTELDDDVVVRMKINCSELELNCKDAESTDKMDLKFMKSAKGYTNGKIKGSAIDVRAYANNAAGTGGGIAMQIASCDGSCKENKFKIETSRTLAPKNGLPATTSDWSKFYCNEGGKGIEIGTINTQFESLYANEFRRNWDGDVFAVSRAPVTIIGDKYDFPTQSDDSKDMKFAGQGSVKWVDIINAVKYLKDSGAIPTDDRFTGCYMVRTNFTNVTSTNTTFAVPSAEALTSTYVASIGALSGYTLNGNVTYTVNGGESQIATGGQISLAVGAFNGDIVINAAATKNA